MVKGRCLYTSALIFTIRNIINAYYREGDLGLNKF